MWAHTCEHAQISLPLTEGEKPRDHLELELLGQERRDSSNSNTVIIAQFITELRAEGFRWLLACNILEDMKCAYRTNEITFFFNATCFLYNVLFSVRPKTLTAPRVSFYFLETDSPSSSFIVSGEGRGNPTLLMGYWHICFMPGNFENLNPFHKFLITNSLIPATPWEHNTGSETLLLLICYVIIHSVDEYHWRFLEIGNLQWTWSTGLLKPGWCFSPFLIRSALN